MFGPDSVGDVVAADEDAGDIASLIPYGLIDEIDETVGVFAV